MPDRSAAKDLRHPAPPAEARDVVACLVDIWIDQLRRERPDATAGWADISVGSADRALLAEPDSFGPEATAAIRAQGIALRCRHQTARSYAATIHNPVHDPKRIAGTRTPPYTVRHCDYEWPTRLGATIVVPYGCSADRVVAPFLIDGRRFCKPSLETFYRIARFERRGGHWVYRGSLDTASSDLSAVPCKDVP